MLRGHGEYRITTIPGGEISNLPVERLSLPAPTAFGGRQFGLRRLCRHPVVAFKCLKVVEMLLKIFIDFDGLRMGDDLT